MAEYTKKLGIPQFEPTGKGADIKELVDARKSFQLSEEAREAFETGKITEEEYDLLKLSASRWLKFDFDKIAEYYCTNANKDMQELMEKHVLVLLDVNDALKAGVVNCREFVEELRQQWLAEHPEN